MPEHDLFISRQSLRDVIFDLVPRVPADPKIHPFVSMALRAGAAAQAKAIWLHRMQCRAYRGMLMLI